MKKQFAKKTTGQHSADPAFLFLPEVTSDFPLTKDESESIALQASVARGWIAAFKEVQP
jgi:hypothetical protein